MAGRFKIEIKNQSTKTIPAYFPIFISAKVFNTSTNNNEGFWNEGRNDGLDIEVYSDSGLTTRMAFHLIHYDQTGKEFSGYAMHTSTIAGSGAGGSYWLVRDDGGQTAQPAPDASGGYADIWDHASGPTFDAVFSGDEDGATGKPKNWAGYSNQYAPDKNGTFTFNDGGHANSHEDLPHWVMGESSSLTDRILIRDLSNEAKWDPPDTTPEEVINMMIYIDGTQASHSEKIDASSIGNIFFSRCDTDNGQTWTDSYNRCGYTISTARYASSNDDGIIFRTSANQRRRVKFDEFATGSWIHLGFIFDEDFTNDVKVYVDGVERTNDSDDWDGTIDDEDVGGGNSDHHRIIGNAGSFNVGTHMKVSAFQIARLSNPDGTFTDDWMQLNGLQHKDPHNVWKAEANTAVSGSITMAVTLTPAVASVGFTGGPESATTATLTPAVADVTVSMEALIETTAALTPNLPVLGATMDVPVESTVALQAAVGSVGFTGGPVVEGTITLTAANPALAATMDVPVEMTVTFTAAAADLNANITFGEITGTTTMTMPLYSIAATGQKVLAGPISMLLPLYNIAATGQKVITGPAAMTLPLFTITGTGQLKKEGPVAMTLPLYSIVAAGTLLKSGIIAMQIPQIAIVASGQLVKSGTIDLTIPLYSMAAAGAASVDGTVAMQMPKYKMSAAGNIPGGITRDIFAPWYPAGYQPVREADDIGTSEHEVPGPK